MSDTVAAQLIGDQTHRFLMTAAVSAVFLSEDGTRDEDDWIEPLEFDSPSTVRSGK